MGKLGKKARKFAKKNLQSVMKRKRKINSMIKRKSSKKEGQGRQVKDEETKKIEQPKERNFEDRDILETPLEDVFGSEGMNEDVEESDSDGYLSEETDKCTEVEQNGTHLEDNRNNPDLSPQNNDIYSELMKKKGKLEKLKKKDPEFSKFLHNHEKSFDLLRDDEAYSDDEASDDGMEGIQEDISNQRMIKSLTLPLIDAWCQQVVEQQNVPALTSLVNAYRAASRYGTESNQFSRGKKILCGLLGISCTSCKKETILNIKSTHKWKTLKPLIKSYLRSTLFILGQMMDSGILNFTLKRLKDVVVFFAAFPSLLHQLLKVLVHLWATDKGSLSSHSFLIICNIASTFGSDMFDTCLNEMYKAFIAHSKFVEPSLLKHAEHLRNCIVKLCSLDVLKSSGKALVSIKHHAKILQLALRTKKKEALKKVCSWQYVNCLDLWVTFTAENISDYDLQALFFISVQIINGVACLFPGPRYLPLRIKCIQWLNTLSLSCGIFIPVASFALDVLEYKLGKTGGKRAQDFKFSSSVKLPKYWLKSQEFQEQCVLSAIELLCVQFDQWSYHISFPELATAPLIRLKQFYETTTVESFKRVVKRFIDQVEQNIDFVRKKRDEVPFSPKDEQAVETFLQLEKSNINISFRQYYRSVIQKAVSHRLLSNETSSSMEKKRPLRKKRQVQNGPSALVINGEKENGEDGKILKKRKT